MTGAAGRSTPAELPVGNHGRAERDPAVLHARNEGRRAAVAPAAAARYRPDRPVTAWTGP